MKKGRKTPFFCTNYIEVSDLLLRNSFGLDTQSNLIFAGLISNSLQISSSRTSLKG